MKAICLLMCVIRMGFIVLHKILNYLQHHYKRTFLVARIRFTKAGQRTVMLAVGPLVVNYS